MRSFLTESNGTQKHEYNEAGSIVRVIIADDHPIVLRGLRSLLSSHRDLHLVGEAETGASAIALTFELQPDILVLDLRMPGISGLDALRHLKRLAPTVKVIVLSSYEDQEHVVQALQAGAYAYILKTAVDQELVEAIRRVHLGERLITHSLMAEVLHHLSEIGDDSNAKNSGLTDGELRVLSAVAEGRSNKEIASQLNWSEITVKRMLQNSMAKLGAANRAQAVAEAYRRGLIYLLQLCLISLSSCLVEQGENALLAMLS